MAMGIEMGVQFLVSITEPGRLLDKSNFAGVTKLDFDAFVHDILNNQWQVHGVEVYCCGQLTYSFGDTCHTKYPIYSATKSILSVAVGIACDQGRLKLERSILDYLPQRIAAQMTQSQRDTYRGITLHRLLTMSVEGYPFRPESDSYLRFSLACPIPAPESIRFHYSNIPAYLMGIALTEAVQEDAWAFINRNILKPLHIIGAEYARCPDGYFYGASGMKLSVNDLSRIGLLLYHGGTFEGNRIVSEDYVERASSVQQMNREGGYGYFFWKYRDGFSINGKWKQKCYVLPKQKRMVTFLSNITDDSNDLILSMEKNILGLW